MFNDFLSALSFLTILPVGKREIRRNSLIYFPVVGLLIGILLVLVNFFLTKFFPFKVNLQGEPSSIANLSILLILILITGGLHIDGFADTVDGFFSGKNRDEILGIMDDPRIGTRAVVAVFFLLLFQFLILEKLKFKYQPLILMATISRSAMVLAILLAEPAKNQGVGRIFLEMKDYSVALIAGLFTLGITIFFLQFKGVLLILITAILVYLMVKYSNKKIGGITGDVLGAINEIIQLCVLFFFLFFS